MDAAALLSGRPIVPSGSCLPVRLSVCPVPFENKKNVQKSQNANICVNAPQGKSTE